MCVIIQYHSNVVLYNTHMIRYITIHYYTISLILSPQMMEFIKKMAGREYVGFSNAT